MIGLSHTLLLVLSYLTESAILSLSLQMVGMVKKLFQIKGKLIHTS